MKEDNAAPLESILVISRINFENFMNGHLNANELRATMFVVPKMWADNATPPTRIAGSYSESQTPFPNSPSFR